MKMTDDGIPSGESSLCQFEPRGSLVKLLAVNSNLALVYEPIAQDYFPQLILCDHISLMEEGLHLMGAHCQ